MRPTGPRGATGQGMRDYYAVLGIGVAATPSEVRRAYRQLARRYSPDVNLWDREAQSLFEEISQAYRVLANPSARRLYDQQAGSGGAPRPSPAGTRAPRGRRGDELHVPVEIGFPQAFSGLALDLAVERASPCEPCRASGTKPGAPAVACGHCGGTGLVWSAAGREPTASPCPACEGTGERVIDPCPACRGRGVRPSRASVHVVLPPGIDSGAQVRVPGEGHAGPFGGPRGDLVVIARVLEDAVFARKGDNVHCELTVALTEAALGARVPLETVAGPLDLVLPPGTQSGQVLRVRGKGMPRLSGEGRGDLHVTIRVEIPRGIDARTQELFRELGRVLPEPLRVAPRKDRQA